MLPLVVHQNNSEGLLAPVEPPVLVLTREAGGKARRGSWPGAAQLDAESCPALGSLFQLSRPLPVDEGGLALNLPAVWLTLDHFNRPLPSLYAHFGNAFYVHFTLILRAFFTRILRAFNAHFTRILRAF